MKTKLIRYEQIINLGNLVKGLARTKGNANPGLDSEVKALFNEQKLIKLQKSLQNQSYKPCPARRVQIPKPYGGTRPLGIASQQDKVVQAAILNLLEPVLEEVFLDSSFGFRPKRNCHMALKEIKTKWQNVTWVINIDVAKYFDTVNHDILMDKLTAYLDQPACELIRKLLKAGYLDLKTGEKVFDPKIGTPQGSLISPILANLYLHGLDCYVQETLLDKYNLGDARKFVKGYHNRKNLSAAQIKTIESLNINGLEKAARSLKHNEWANLGKPGRDPHDEGFRRLHYVRYADDFIVGFSGPKIEAEEIKNLLIQILQNNLKLKVNEDKSRIYYSGERGIKFLGFFVRYLEAKITRSLDPGQGVAEAGIRQIKRVSINQAQLRVPVKNLLEKAVEHGYATYRKTGTIRATSCRKLSSLEDRQIVIRFSSIIRGILAYYDPANQKSDLWQVVAVYRKSCALTLADKHKLKTAAKVYKRYGPKLRVNSPTSKKASVELYYPESLKTTTNFKTGAKYVGEWLLINDPIQGSYKQLPKTANICQYEGCMETSNLQEHHINPQINIPKNLSPFSKSLRSKERVTVSLCKKHHDEIHNRK